MCLSANGFQTWFASSHFQNVRHPGVFILVLYTIAFLLRTEVNSSFELRPIAVLILNDSAVQTTQARQTSHSTFSPSRSVSASKRQLAREVAAQAVVLGVRLTSSAGVTSLLSIYSLPSSLHTQSSGLVPVLVEPPPLRTAGVGT